MPWIEIYSTALIVCWLYFFLLRVCIQLSWDWQMMMIIMNIYKPFSYCIYPPTVTIDKYLFNFFFFIVLIWNSIRSIYLNILCLSSLKLFELPPTFIPAITKISLADSGVFLSSKTFCASGLNYQSHWWIRRPAYISTKIYHPCLLKIITFRISFIQFYTLIGIKNNFDLK